MSNQQVNRLELGRIDSPTMADLVALGEVFGFTPNEMAALYGYWNGADDVQHAADTPEVSRIRRLFSTLPEDGRAWLAHELQWVLTQSKRFVS